MSRGLHICSFSFGDYVLAAKGREYRFEMSNIFGPTLLGKKGDPLSNQKCGCFFWSAVSLWDFQGRRVSEDGDCLWDYPPKNIVKHLGGRHYQVIGQEAPVRGS